MRMLAGCGAPTPDGRPPHPHSQISRLIRVGDTGQPNPNASLTLKNSVISLFSGALGLDLGMERAGFQVAACVEDNKFAAETIRRNRPSTPLLRKKIQDVSTEELLREAGLATGEATIVTAGPCCQAYSTAGQRGSVEDPRGTLFREFLRVVDESQPRFFVMENVRGLLSAAVKHRPLKERGPGFPPLEPEEQLGSAFRMVVEALKKTGYYCVFGVLNAADFGVPQRRERVIVVGSRDLEPFEMPEPTHCREETQKLKRWRTLKDVIGDLSEDASDFNGMSEKKKQYIRMVPEGGNWRDLPVDVQEEALGAAYGSWGGRVGFFRRLAWDAPAPSLTTRPDSKATMLCHPEADRPLSVREYARVQQFPDDWVFVGGPPSAVQADRKRRSARSWGGGRRCYREGDETAEEGGARRSGGLRHSNAVRSLVGPPGNSSKPTTDAATVQPCRRTYLDGRSFGGPWCLAGS